MGLLSSIWNLIKKIFSAIFSWLADLFGDWFLVLLILVVIWFAPVIAAWLVSVGAPAFAVSFFEAISVLTPYLQAAGAWLWKGGGQLVSTAWDAYKGLSAGMQASIAIGAAAMIAPEETAAVLEDAAAVVATGASAVFGAVVSNPVGFAVIAGALWFFLSGRKRERAPSPQPTGAS